MRGFTLVKNFGRFCEFHPSVSWGRHDDKSEAKSVRVGSMGVKDDSAPTPLMSKVSIIPHTGTPFKFDVLPDTGCYQTLISTDLVSANGMIVDTHDKKTLKTVNSNRMNCSGSVTFKVEYEGRKTDVLALVSSSIQEEIQLADIATTGGHLKELAAHWHQGLWSAQFGRCSTCPEGGEDEVPTLTLAHPNGTRRQGHCTEQVIEALGRAGNNYFEMTEQVIICDRH